MRKYSLSRHPAEHYPKYLRHDALVFVPYRAAGRYDLSKDRRRPHIFNLDERPERYKCRVGEDELAFGLYIESQDGAVVPDLVEVAREVLAHIIELDLFANEIDPNDESQSSLMSVDITREMIHLRYVPTLFNSEWGTAFKRVGPGEFEYLGPCL